MLLLKKIIIITLVVVFATPSSVFAFALRPFGGQIISVNTPPNVTCVTNLNSPFTIRPVMGPTGPWSAMVGPVNIGQITPSAWILGLIQVGTGSCVTGSTPPVSYPTTTTNFYGTSSSF